MPHHLFFFFFLNKRIWTNTHNHTLLRTLLSDIVKKIVSQKIKYNQEIKTYSQEEADR